MGFQPVSSAAPTGQSYCNTNGDTGRPGGYPEVLFFANNKKKKKKKKIRISPVFITTSLRDWSLIMGMGGLQNGRGGGHVKFYPYEKGGGGKSFSHADGGTNNLWVVFTQ